MIFEAAHGYAAKCPPGGGLGAQRAGRSSLGRQTPAPNPRRAGAHRAARSVLLEERQWVTGIRFASKNEPGYWEQRGYHDRGDPWKEERYA